MKKRYFEDFQLNETITMGPRHVTRDEIIAFATRYDPQPFHLDDAAGRATPFGGLVASGWHTIAMCMRMMVDGWIGQSASMGSPGIDQLRWLKPVRPDDDLTLTMIVRTIVPSKSKPDRGIVKSDYELKNALGEVVMTFSGMGLYGRRPS